jgi:hypothetical protein
MKRFLLAAFFLCVATSILSSCGYSRKRTGCPMQAKNQQKAIQTHS